MFTINKCCDIPVLPSFSDNSFFRYVSFESDVNLYLINLSHVSGGDDSKRSFFFLRPEDLHRLINETGDDFRVESLYFITPSNEEEVIGWKMEKIKVFGACYKDSPFPSLFYFQCMEDDRVCFDRDGVGPEEISEYEAIFSQDY